MLDKWFTLFLNAPTIVQLLPLLSVPCVYHKKSVAITHCCDSFFPLNIRGSWVNVLFQILSVTRGTPTGPHDNELNTCDPLLVARGIYCGNDSCDASIYQE